MATDAELIRQTLQGNERAFASLIEKYQLQILALCQQMVKNRQDAEELTQDTFLCAYQNLGQLRDREKFLPWLKQVARNQCKMYLRRETSTPVSLTDYPQLIAHQATAEEWVLHQELLDAILQAIETLPAKDRQVLRAHLDGLSHAEICERTALSYRASLNRLYRARQKIKAKVRHLLSGIVALPQWFSNSKLFSGGITIMKITTPTKITIGVFGLLLVGFLGWKALHHEGTQITQKMSVAQKQPSSGLTTFKPIQPPQVSSQTTTPVEGETAPSESNKAGSFEADAAELERLLEEWALEESLTELDSSKEETMQSADTMQTNTEQNEETTKDIQFDSGYLSPHFVTDEGRMEAVLETPRILVYDGQISNIGAMVPLLERIHQSGDPLLILANGLPGDSLQTLVVNKVRGVLKVVAVQAPGYGDERQNMLKNIVTKTGGRLISNEMDLRYLTPGDLGIAQRVVIDSGRTTIVP